jgi:predicted dehydrogenase
MSQKKKIGMGLVGPGFIAPHHIDAVRRLGNVEVVAIAGSSEESAKQKAAQYGVEKAYGDYKALIADPAVDVVHNTTPSYLHFPVSLAALQAGKHIISDKPLAITSEECSILASAAAKAGVVNAVTFNYRGNAMVQQARTMIAQNEIGAPIFIHGQYLQDWLTDPNVYSWRLDPVKGGASSALADIGSHWCDLAEHVSGAKITAVLADLTTVVKTRYAPEGSVEAFSSNQSVNRKPVKIEAEDLASVLLHFDNGAKGCFTVGQTLPGHKNGLRLEINGRLASLGWKQEEQNDLWIGKSDGPNMMLTKDPAMLHAAARKYAHLPAGHQGGWSDAFHNVVADAYSWISTGEKSASVCTFADGYRVCLIIDAILASHHAGGRWTQVAQAGEPVIAQVGNSVINGRQTKAEANAARL